MALGGVAVVVRLPATATGRQLILTADHPYHAPSNRNRHFANISIRSRSGLSPANLVIQHATEALSDSDQTTLAKYANLSNSLPDFRFVTVCRADVERS